jgi:hypothetical protein
MRVAPTTSLMYQTPLLLFNPDSIWLHKNRFGTQNGSAKKKKKAGKGDPRAVERRMWRREEKVHTPPSTH